MSITCKSGGQNAWSVVSQVKPALVLLYDFAIKHLSDVSSDILAYNAKGKLLAKACEESTTSEYQHEAAPEVRLTPHLIIITDIHQHEKHLCHNSTKDGHQGSLHHRDKDAYGYKDPWLIVLKQSVEV